LDALQALDVDPPGVPFHGIRYLRGRTEATARFRSGPGRGVRRTSLHECLAEAVAARDIPVVETDVESVEQDQDGVRASGHSARYLLAADGLHSTVRDLAGLSEPVKSGSGSAMFRAPSRRYGLRRHFAVTPWADVVEVHWAADSEAYVTPVAPDLVGVALLTSRREPYETQLGSFPQILERLGDALDAPATTARGAGPLRQPVRARTAGRVLLVGDAAGYVDALTGEGIAVGLATARAAVAAVRRDDPAAYERDWWKATRRYRWITESLLWARHRRMTAGLIVPGARHLPGVFPAAVNALAR
jgi:flavin-dependent dehydrogenase